MSSPPTQETPVALELVQTLREMREMRATLAKRDAELEDGRAKRAKLETECDATKRELEALRRLHPVLDADGVVACAIFAHVRDPKDRIRLAAVSKVFQVAYATVFVGTDERLIFYDKDGARTRNRITPPPPPRGRTIV